MAALTALAIGGLASAAGGYFSAREQRKSADKARRDLLATGAAAAGQLQGDRGAALDELTAGTAAAQGYQQRALGTLGQQQNEIGSLFAQQRGVGSSGLSQLQRMFIEGDMSAIENDPGYQFRLQQGNKALQRAASASGSFGSSRNLADFARFGQGLASQEVNNAYSRLLGIAGIGERATQAQAGLGTGLAQSQAGVQQSQAGLESQLGANRAQARSSYDLAAANARLGTGTQAAQATLAEGQAAANQYNALFGPVSQAATLYGLSKLT